MSDKPSAFERDKTRLLGLLREAIFRMRQESSRESFGDIFPMLREIEEAELAVKLGFATAPFVLSERPQPGFSRFRVLIWNDPFGNLGGEIVVSSTVRSGNQETDPNALRDKESDKEIMAALMERWIRAVEAKVEPDAYPALPPYLAPGAPRHLWADPLWRRLFFMIAVFEKNGSPSYWDKKHHFTFSLETMKVNRLAAESGLAGSVPFRFGGRNVSIHDPMGKHVVDLERDGEGISEPDRSKKEQVVACLRAWQDARAGQLEGDGAQSQHDPASKSPLTSQGIAGEPQRGRVRAPAPAGWIYATDAKMKYKIKGATFQGYRNRLAKRSPPDAEKDANSNQVRVRERALRELLGLPPVD